MAKDYKIDEKPTTYYNVWNACKKCGATRAATHYVGFNDTIRRTCNECGYVWFEFPVDGLTKKIVHESAPKDHREFLVESEL